MVLMPLTSLGMGSVQVSWDASTNATVTGYNVYYGTSSGNYPNIVNAGAAVSKVIPNLTDGTTYYIAVTAFDGSGNESDFSTEVSYTVPLGVNVPPTISGIANQTISSGQSTGLVPFTVNDPNTGPTGLTLSGTSDNQTLVPNGNITFDGGDANRTVTVTAAAGQTGTANITVTVSDGSLTAHTNFTVSVQAGQQNHAPTITAIGAQTLTAGQSTGAIPFTIGDQDTGASSLAVSAVSDNQALVPNGSIVLNGSGASRTVKVMPASGQIGTAQVTVTVSDGILTAQSSFTVTVQAQQPPVNHAPTISAIGTQTTYAGVSSGAIPFTVGDQDTGPNGLTLSATSGNQTLVPNGSIMFGGSGANRTVTLTPAAGQTGSAQITVTVSDGSLMAQSSFTVNVQVATAISTLSLPKTSTYNGLFYESDAMRLQSAGSVRITVSSKGKYSGSLQMAGGKYSFSGTFGALCVGTNIIARKVGAPLRVGFTLKPGAKAGQLVGTLSDGTWTAQMGGGQAVYNSKTAPAPYSGSFTFVVPGQDGAPGFSLGNGFGSLTVDGNGNVKFSGSLADGTKITQASGLTVDGSWPLFVPLYAGQGCLMGWVSFTNRAQDDLNGPVNWIKSPNSVSKYYPAGLAVQANTVGSKFNSAAPNPLVFGQAKLQFGSSSGELIMSLKLAKTGTFTGLMFNPTTGKGMPFQGALLQKVSTGYGFLLGTNQSTPVTLTH